jgi:predicted transcriptional regulator
MASLGNTLFAAGTLGALVLLYMIGVRLARRQRARALAARGGAVAPEAPAPVTAAATAAGPGDPALVRLERRMEDIEEAQAALAARVAGEGGEARLKEMAGSLAGLIRDKSATLETALAGLDQLRARLKTLEQIGDLAEARGLFEGLSGRIAALETAREAAASAGNPFAEIAEQLTRLYAQKDATTETVFARLAPVEAKLREIETGLAARDPAAALERVEARIKTEIATLRDRLRGIEAGETPALATLTERMAGLADRAGTEAAEREGRLGPLEARLAALEAGAGDLAAARAEIGGLAARIEDGRAAFAAEIAALRAAAAENPFAEISEQLTRLYEQKDATVETVFARLAPLETRLAEMEGRLAGLDPQAALDRFAERLETAKAAHAASEAALRDRIAALENPGETPFAQIAEQLTRLYAQKDATVETVFARLAPLEAKLAGMEARLSGLDPEAALARFAERLEAAQAAQAAAEAALRDRIAALEEPGETPFAEIADQLTRLYAQKDATVETVFARLAPLEAKLGAVEGRLAGLDPQAALDRFAERLEAATAALDGRVAALEGAENPFAEIGAQLTRLYAQKDATVETVFARLAPLEAKLAEVEGRLGGLDPAAALARFAERLEAAQAAHEAAEAALRDRIAALEAPGENPFAEIAEQLTRLYAQKDATVETVFARLAPLEAKLSEIEGGLAGLDPRAALDRFAERLEALQARLAAVEEPGENPFAEIAEQLTRLYAQKDATVETVFARLAPLEAKLAEIEGGLAGLDPRAALDRFAERLEALQVRLAAVEDPGENPFGEIADQLTRLYAQKDATVETVFARLAPLEAKLGALEGGLAGSLPRLAALEAELAARDPGAALADLAARVAALQADREQAAARIDALQAALGETAAGQPFGEIADQLTRLYAQKDAAVAAVMERLAPLEAQLAALGDRPWEEATEAARAEAEAVAAQLIALSAAAAQTELFADRLALLEANLPRLSAAQLRMMELIERQVPGASQASPARAAAPAPADAPAAVPTDAAGLEALRDLPRVVTMHHK